MIASLLGRHVIKVFNEISAVRWQMFIFMVIVQVSGRCLLSIFFFFSNSSFPRSHPLGLGSTDWLTFWTVLAWIYQNHIGAQQWPNDILYRMHLPFFSHSRIRPRATSPDDNSY